MRRALQPSAGNPCSSGTERTCEPMAIPEHTRQAIERFFAAIEPRLEAYSRSTFSYVAVRRGAAFLLVKGILSLNTGTLPSKAFRSENLCAGRCQLETVAPSPRAFVEQLLQGEIRTPDELVFPLGNGGYHAGYAPFHAGGLQVQGRTNVLTIAGAERGIEGSQLELDWELKAAAVPYDSLNELFAEFGLGVLTANVATVEVVAHYVAAVDAASTVEGKQVILRARLAHGLHTEGSGSGSREPASRGVRMPMHS